MECLQSDKEEGQTLEEKLAARDAQLKEDRENGKYEPPECNDPDGCIMCSG